MNFVQQKSVKLLLLLLIWVRLTISKVAADWHPRCSPQTYHRCSQLQ